MAMQMEGIPLEMSDGSGSSRIEIERELVTAPELDSIGDVGDLATALSNLLENGVNSLIEGELKPIQFKNIGNYPLFITDITGELFSHATLVDNEWANWRLNDSSENEPLKDESSIINFPLRINPNTDKKSLVIYVKTELIGVSNVPSYLTITTNEINYNTRRVKILYPDFWLKRGEGKLKATSINYDNVPSSNRLIRGESDQGKNTIGIVSSIRKKDFNSFWVIIEKPTGSNINTNGLVVGSLITIYETDNHNGLYEILEVFDGDGNTIKLSVKGKFNNNESSVGYWTVFSDSDNKPPVFNGSITNNLNNFESLLTEDSGGNTYLNNNEKEEVEEFSEDRHLNFDSLKYFNFECTDSDIINYVKDHSEGNYFYLGWCPGLGARDYIYSTENGKIPIDVIFYAKLFTKTDNTVGVFDPEYIENSFLKVVLGTNEIRFFPLVGGYKDTIDESNDATIGIEVEEVTIENVGSLPLDLINIFVANRELTKADDEGLFSDNGSTPKSSLFTDKEIFTENGRWSSFSGENKFQIPYKSKKRFAFVLSHGRYNGNFIGKITWIYKTFSIPQISTTDIRSEVTDLNIKFSYPQIDVFLRHQYNVNDFENLDSWNYVNRNYQGIKSYDSHYGIIDFTKADFKNKIDKKIRLINTGNADLYIFDIDMPFQPNNTVETNRDAYLVDRVDMDGDRNDKNIFFTLSRRVKPFILKPINTNIKNLNISGGLFEEKLYQDVDFKINGKDYNQLNLEMSLPLNIYSNSNPNATTRNSLGYDHFVLKLKFNHTSGNNGISGWSPPSNKGRSRADIDTPGEGSNIIYPPEGSNPYGNDYNPIEKSKGEYFLENLTQNYLTSKEQNNQISGGQIRVKGYIREEGMPSNMNYAVYVSYKNQTLFTIANLSSGNLSFDEIISLDSIADYINSGDSHKFHAHQGLDFIAQAFLPGGGVYNKTYLGGLPIITGIENSIEDKKVEIRNLNKSKKYPQPNLRISPDVSGIANVTVFSFHNDTNLLAHEDFITKNGTTFNDFRGQKFQEYQDNILSGEPTGEEIDSSGHIILPEDIDFTEEDWIRMNFDWEVKLIKPESHIYDILSESNFLEENITTEDKNDLIKRWLETEGHVKDGEAFKEYDELSTVGVTSEVVDVHGKQAGYKISYNLDWDNNSHKNFLANDFDIYSHSPTTIYHYGIDSLEQNNQQNTFDLRVHPNSGDRRTYMCFAHAGIWSVSLIRNYRENLGIDPESGKTIYGDILVSKKDTCFVLVKKEVKYPQINPEILDFNVVREQSVYSKELTIRNFSPVDKKYRVKILDDLPEGESFYWLSPTLQLSSGVEYDHDETITFTLPKSKERPIFIPKVVYYDRVYENAHIAQREPHNYKEFPVIYGEPKMFSTDMINNDAELFAIYQSEQSSGTENPSIVLGELAREILGTDVNGNPIWGGVKLNDHGLNDSDYVYVESFDADNILGGLFEVSTKIPNPDWDHDSSLASPEGQYEAGQFGATRYIPSTDKFTLIKKVIKNGVNATEGVRGFYTREKLENKKIKVTIKTPDAINMSHAIYSNVANIDIGEVDYVNIESYSEFIRGAETFVHIILKDPGDYFFLEKSDTVIIEGSYRFMFDGEYEVEDSFSHAMELNQDHSLTSHIDFKKTTRLIIKKRFAPNTLDTLEGLPKGKLGKIKSTMIPVTFKYSVSEYTEYLGSLKQQASLF